MEPRLPSVRNRSDEPVGPWVLTETAGRAPGASEGRESSVLTFPSLLFGKRTVPGVKGGTWRWETRVFFRGRPRASLQGGELQKSPWGLRATRGKFSPPSATSLVPRSLSSSSLLLPHFWDLGSSWGKWDGLPGAAS